VAKKKAAKKKKKGGKKKSSARRPHLASRQGSEGPPGWGCTMLSPTAAGHTA